MKMAVDAAKSDRPPTSLDATYRVPWRAQEPLLTCTQTVVMPAHEVRNKQVQMLIIRQGCEELHDIYGKATMSIQG